MKCEFSLWNWVRGQLNIDKTPPIDLESRVFHRYFLNLSFKMDSHSPRHSFGWKIFMKFFFLYFLIRTMAKLARRGEPSHLAGFSTVVRLWPWWTIELQLLLPPHQKKKIIHIPKLGKSIDLRVRMGRKMVGKFPLSHAHRLAQLLA